MNSVKWYVIFHSLILIVMVICITIAACYFNKWDILWFYLIPGLCMGREVRSEPVKKDTKETTKEINNGNK